MLAKFDLPGGSAFLRQLLHWNKIVADEHKDNPRKITGLPISLKGTHTRSTMEYLLRKLSLKSWNTH